MMLDKDNAALVVIDVQGKLAEAMDGKEDLFENVKRLVRGAKVLGLPVILTEQYPKGLGPTRPDIAELIDSEPIAKTAFSCCGEPAFVEALEATGRRQVLLCGIETHVCVYQTAAGLIDMGYGTHVVLDAVSSRTARNRRLGIEKMKDCGAQITGVEMALFEMLKVAGGDEFKQMIQIVK
jgi:nicotinamidase-related amidase